MRSAATARRISVLPGISTWFPRATAGAAIHSTGEIHDGILVGRGANDMKSAVAAFVAAISRFEQGRGTVSLLITGDEEGFAAYGTPRIIDWLKERQIRPDMILIGEPTSVERLGDTVKIGRRGSVNMWIEVPGIQGHVAYPERTENPIPPLARVIAALDSLHLDDGSEQFPPSNLEFTSISTPTNASNVIPGSATAQLNIRFNNLQRGADLVKLVEEIAEREAPGAKVKARISGEAFLTPPGQLYDVIVQAIEEETGDNSGAVDQWRHVRRPLPYRALPSRGFRPAQRDHAQGRRMRSGRRYSRAVADL